MRVLMVGDIIGRPGRAAFAKYTAMLRREKKIDIVVANGENSSGGKGISRKSMIYRLFESTPDEALNGTTVLNTIALMKGANILRVHDVRPAAEAIRIVSELHHN